MQRYEIAIIGSGPAGYVGAIKAAREGFPTAVIEKGDFGGVCLNTGCIPTKALVASAKQLRNVRRAADFGIDLKGSVSAIFQKLYERMNHVVDIERKGLVKLVENSGTEIIKGQASFVDDNVLKISGADGEKTINAKNIIIATGSNPKSLPFLPFDGEKVVSSNDLLSLESLPESMIIIGGGYIGCEFASIFSALGTKITIIEALPSLLMNVDEDIVKVLTREFKKEGVEVKADSQIVGAKVADKVTVTLADGTDISADVCLVSVGRRPLTEGLAMEGIGLPVLPDGAIKVNERMMTDIPGVFAVGDVVGNPMLAYVASAECKVAVGNALGNRLLMDYTVIPIGIFTYPEIGSVGVTERQARSAGVDVKTGTVLLRSLGISHASGDIVGMAKLVADSVSDMIIGVHIIGERATDLVHEAAVAMYQGMTASAFGNVLHTHPTFSEIVSEAAHAVNGTAIFSGKQAA